MATSSAPMKQPPIEPRPPMMTTMKTSTVRSFPIEACTCSRYSAHITPPRPASPDPTMNTPRNKRRMGHDQPAGGHQDLLEMLAVHREDQYALDQQPERTGDRHRQHGGRRQHREICQQRVGLQ